MPIAPLTAIIIIPSTIYRLIPVTFSVSLVSVNKAPAPLCSPENLDNLGHPYLFRLISHHLPPHTVSSDPINGFIAPCTVLILRALLFLPGMPFMLSVTEEFFQLQFNCSLTWEDSSRPGA